MTELGTHPEKQLEIFRENFSKGLAEKILIYERYNLTGEDYFQTIDPNDMFIEERFLNELSPQEKQIIGDELFRQLGIKDHPDRHKLRQYSVFNPVEGEEFPEQIDVQVYSTEKETIYLHEFIFPDHDKQWIIGPDMDVYN